MSTTRSGWLRTPFKGGLLIVIIACCLALVTESRWRAQTKGISDQSSGDKQGGDKQSAMTAPRRSRVAAKISEAADGSDKYTGQYYRTITTITSPDDGAPIPPASEQLRTLHIAGRFRFDEGDVTYRKVNGYDVVELKGAVHGRVAPGLPDLPVTFVSVLIPENTNADDIRFAVTEKPLKSEMHIYPMQPPRTGTDSSARVFIEPDQSVYGRDDLYPAQAVEVKRLNRQRGNRYITVAIHPIRYKPASGELVMAESVQMSMGVANDPEGAHDLTRRQEIDASVRGLVFNKDLMDAIAETR